jgi:UDP-perosamine 4-acetyltransferase
MGVIVIGAGGHAKVIIELLVASGHVVDYCIASDDSTIQCLDVEVVNGEQQLERLFAKGYRLIFPAIGSNVIRERLARQAIDVGYTLINAISPHAMISTSAIIGCGVAVMGGSVINAEACISDMAIINTGSTIDHDCHIGECAHIAPHCALAGNVIVGRQAFLGIGTIVIPKVTIGEHACIGAGSVVVRDIPSFAMAMGNPAKTILKNSDQN